MTLAIWPNKLSLTCIPPNQQHSLAFIHGQNCLSGSCGIQLHKPRDPGGVSPTQASSHRHTHLGPGCGPWTCSRLPQPLSPAAWVPLESTALDNHLPTRKPLWKPTFPKAKFQHTVGTTKRNTSLDTLERERIAWLYPRHPPHKEAQLRAKWFPPQGKMRACE